MQIPGNVLLVGDYSEGDLEQNKKYSSLDLALEDSNSGDLILCFKSFETYTPKSGVNVVFVPALDYSTLLDPNTGNIGDIPQIIEDPEDASNKVLQWKTADEAISVNYQFLRARAYQAGTGKMFLYNPDTTGTTDELTIADEYYHAGSSRVSTGVYKLQFRTSVDGVMTNSFSPEIQEALLQTGSQGVFEKKVYSVYGGYSEGHAGDEVLLGYLVFPVNNVTGDFDILAGRLIALTYSPDGITLTDGILALSQVIELKAFV